MAFVRSVISRFVVCAAIGVVAACSTVPSGAPIHNAEPPLLTDENFFGAVPLERIDSTEAQVRAAMAECASTGVLSVQGSGGSFEDALVDTAAKLTLALRRSGANTWALTTHQWELPAQGGAALGVQVSGLICSA